MWKLDSEDVERLWDTRMIFVMPNLILLLMRYLYLDGFSPVRGIVKNNNIMDTIKPVDHDSIYGENPLGMVFAKTVMRLFLEEGMVKNSQIMGKILHDNLNSLSSPLIKEVSSRGLFCGTKLYHDLNRWQGFRQNTHEERHDHQSHSCIYNSFCTSSCRQRTWNP